jgi:phosphatidate cytidylyltransferase
MSKAGSSLARRLLASAIFIPCLIILARKGGIYYLALIDLVILVGLWEFYRVMETKGLKPYKWVGIVCGTALPWLMYYSNGLYGDFLLVITFLGIMIVELLRKDKEQALYHISVTIFGILYVSWLGNHMAMIRELPLSVGMDYSFGFSFVIILFTVTWCYDTGAYTIGRLLGKHKLVPSISPEKTVEGAVGGIAFSIMGILTARAIVEMPLDVPQAVCLAVIASVFGQLGDLVESMIKRDARIKDTSTAIPGHGGILDRFDSLLFTAPLVYYIMKYYILGT